MGTSAKDKPRESLSRPDSRGPCETPESVRAERRSLGKNREELGEPGLEQVEFAALGENRQGCPSHLQVAGKSMVSLDLWDY